MKIETAITIKVSIASVLYMEQDKPIITVVLTPQELADLKRGIHLTTLYQDAVFVEDNGIEYGPR